MWLEHVKKTRKMLPSGTMFKDVLKAAKKTWKKAKGVTAKVVKKVGKKAKSIAKKAKKRIIGGKNKTKKARKGKSKKGKSKKGKKKSMKKRK